MNEKAYSIHKMAREKSVLYLITPPPPLWLTNLGGRHKVQAGEEIKKTDTHHNSNSLVVGTEL